MTEEKLVMTYIKKEKDYQYGFHNIKVTMLFRSYMYYDGTTYYI